ncbi:hypothetical protein E4T81_07155 [Barnesiella sp. WM24]|uniref:DUF5672 family protein n=1 Tax=Barnesiella sp. WM24 TaxID=2558278 RepID=UPI001072192D|nr:DUF5672 family protein [Barnesiella sp. WM24]TFU93730.1 hypothetical protein E4T81_07155 [Barnesiella sp. WM24]
MEKVNIVIPAYKSTLHQYEEISLRAVAANLSRHPVTFVVPEGLDISKLTGIVKNAGVETFDPSYFQGIAGYNRLMMSEEFYDRFAGFNYILIYQLDAYVFSDRLLEWCDKGYDYVGAPWLVRPIYKFPLLKLGSKIKHGFRKMLHMPDERATWWQVGNGGLSLRRVESHLRAVRELRQEIDRYLLYRNHIYNEDVFFSTEVNRHGLGFSYPDWEEALDFAFDKYPKLCYKLNGKKLPFGCHAWQKRRMRKFWFPIILKDTQ